MTKHLVTNLFSIFIFALQINYSNCQGCYQWNPDGRLAYQTIQYSDPTSMTVSNCQQFCLGSNTNFAAIEAGMYCFCGTLAPNAVPVSNQTCNQTCTGYTTNAADLQCGSFTEAVWVIDLTNQVSSPINNITITAIPQSTTITTQVTFSITVDSLSSNYEYSFDYGDGSPQTDFYSPSFAPLYKTYYAPGIYTATVFVQNAAGSLRAASTLITVTLPISEVTPLNCTPMANVSETINCSFTAGLGTNMQLYLDFGDGTNINVMLPDTYYFSAGLSPSPYGDSSMLATSVNPSGTTAFMEMSEFQSDGDIYGFEFAFNQTTNSMQLSVVCPLSSCNYCYDANDCNGCPSGIVSSVNGTTSCSSSNSLYFNSVDESCRNTADGSPAISAQRYSQSSTDYSKYDFGSRTFTVPVMSQPNTWALVNQASRFSVSSGCILSYVPGASGAIIAYRPTLADEVSDTWISIPGYTENIPKSIRHFLKAYAFQPQTVIFQHKYNQDGLYTVSGAVSNSQSSVPLVDSLVQVNIVLTVQCPPFAIINRQITCTVTSPTASAGGTYSWSFGDGSAPLSVSLKANYTYSTLGTFMINVTRKSPTTNFYLSYNVSIAVIECSCCPPILASQELSQDSLQPIKFKKSEMVYQSIFVYLTCNDTLSNNKIWNLEMVDMNNPPNVLQTLSIPQSSQNNSFIQFEPYSLPFGLFRVTVTVSMNSAQTLYGGYPIASSLQGYFFIEPGSLIPIIYKNQSQITLTQGSTVILDPGDYTIDPNEPPGTPQQFSSFLWTCQSVSGTVAMVSDPDVPTLLTNCQSSTTSIRQLSDLGWGFLPLNSSYLTSGSQYILNLTVNRTVTVYSSQYTLSGTANLLINIISQPTTPMEIQCKVPTICFASTSSITVNPTSTLLLSATCPTCPSDSPASSYQWSISDNAGNIINYSPYSQGDGTMLSVTPDFFSAYIQNPLMVSLIYTFNGQVNYGYVTLLINQPPMNGYCTINATSGKASLDLFYVTCQEWTSSNNIVSYVLYKVDGGIETDIMSVPFMDHTITLPSGLSENGFQYQLWAEIVDSLGATTQFYINTVSITPFVGSYQDILNQLDVLKNEGDLGTVLAYINSVANSANFQLTDTTNTNTQTSGTSFWIIQPDCLYIPIDASCDNRTFASWIRSNLLSAINEFQPQTLLDVCSMANAVNAVIIPSELNINGSKSTNDILKKMNSVFQATASYSSPELVYQTSLSLFAMTSSFITAVDYGLNNLPNIGDQIYLQKYEYDNYDVSLPEDPSDIVYFEDMTVAQWQVDAARRAQTKIASYAANYIQNAVDEMASALFNDSVVGSSPKILNVPNGEMILQYDRAANLISNVTLIDGVQLYFPDFCQFTQISNCSGNFPVQRKIVYYSNNLNKYADPSNLTTTGSVDIDFFEPDSINEIPISNTSVPLVMKFPQNIYVSTTDIKPSLSSYRILQIHRINMTKQNSTLEIDFTVSNPAVQFALYLRYADNILDKYVGSMNGEYDYMTTISYNQYPFTWILPSDSIFHRGGIFYLGVGQLSPGDPTSIQLGNNSFLQNFTTDYTVGISAPSCHYFQPTDLQWETDGCVVSPETTTLLTVCNCYHLTVFSAGLFVPPNTIDFDYVFAHADFSENISIYMSIIVILVLYIIFVLWAKNKDQQDLEKIGCVPMLDNDINDHYIYEIVVTTGLRKAAATDSKVHIVVSGDLGDTDQREFSHPLGAKHIFRRGMTNHFVMTTRKSLGDLHCVRVWHDNSGRGEFCSWYLNEIVILDIQTGRKYPFVSNQWFAVEHGDGEIDRILPVSTKEELTEFNHLFSSTTKNELFDGHIWFSVFARPPGSRFTRVQRVSCCLCVLMTSMLASAMWYGTVPDNPHQGLSIGPFSLSYAEVGVGVLSSFVVFPINFIVVYIFRKSPQRTKRPSRFFEAFKTWMPHFIKIGRAKNIDKSSKNLPDHVPTTTKASGRKKPFLLPWWCRYVAWILIFLGVSISIIFIVFYGIQFGDSKSRQWLSSMIVSFFSSVLLTEPIQIILTALLFSLICRKAQEEIDDDWIQDEHDFGLKPNQQYLDGTGHSTYRFFDEQDKEKLENTKITRRVQLGTYNTVREVMVYVLYVWIVFVLAYGGRDPLSYQYQKNLLNIFLSSRSNPNLDYINNVDTINTYWQWAREVLAPGLRAPHWYNGKPNIGERGFIADHTNRLLGFATMRQVRTKPNTCSVPNSLRSFFNDCAGFSHIKYEQTGNFGTGWQQLTDGQMSPLEYRYSSASQLNNTVTSGLMDAYSGGGYVVTLIGPIAAMVDTFQKLQNDSWIDVHTRAVFVEFSTYDVNANLFSINQIAAEFSPDGSIIRWAYFQPVQLLPYSENFALLVLICQAIFALYVVIFIVKEIRNIKVEGKNYFFHFWSWIEMSIIVTAIFSIVSYALRLLETNRCLDILDKTNGNTILSLQYAQLLDSIYTVAVGFCIFAGTLKMARLLRFNRRIALVQTTFHNCKQDMKHFFFIFFILFFLFCQVFYVLMNAKMETFTNFLSTMCSMFAFLMGQQEYKDLFSASPILSPIFFIIYIVIMVLLMVNVFLAIIISMFIAIKHDSTKHSNEYEILDYMELKLRLFFGLPPSINQRAMFNNHHGDVSSYKILDKKMDKLIKRLDSLFFRGTLNRDMNRKTNFRNQKIRQTN